MDNAWALDIAEQHVVHIWSQRSPLASDRHVTRAKICHRHDPRALGNHAGFTELQGGTYRIPTQQGGLWQMLNRLAVRTNQIDLADVDASLAGHLQGRFGEDLSQRDIEAAEQIDCAGSWV